MAGGPAKLLSVIGLLLKNESTYNTPVALSTTADGVQMQFKSRDTPSLFTMGYTFDGDLGPSVSGFGTIARVPPSGRSAKGSIPTRARPGGAAYSASVIPSIHTLLKIAGFDATLVTTVGNESWTYKPTPPGTTYASGTAQLFSKGETMTLAGVLSNVKFDAPDPSPPLWTFDAQGTVSSMPSDSAFPVITYPLQTVAPPLASSVALTFGSLSTNAVVKNSSFDFQRKLTARVAQSGGGGHLGFVPDDFIPMLKLTIEAMPLTTTPFTSSTAIDPYQLMDLAQQLSACSVQYGTTQYNRYTLSLPQAQVTGVNLTADGPTALLELTVIGANSTASSNDSVSLTFN